MVFQLIDNSIVFHGLADMLFALFRPRRQNHFELLAFCPVHQNIDVLLRQFLERHIQTETIMSRQAVQNASAPAFATIVHRGRDKCPFIQ